MLLILDSNEYIFALGPNRKPASEKLLGNRGTQYLIRGNKYDVPYFCIVHIITVHWLDPAKWLDPKTRREKRL